MNLLLRKKSLLVGAGALAAILGIARAQQVFSTPVGYQTETIKNGYNVIGVNVLAPPLVSSSLTAVAGTTLTDANTGIHFSTALPSGSVYSIEFANGALGMIASYTANSVTTTENISAALALPAANNKYIIRKVRTLGDLFGATNTSGLRAGDTSTADIIWIPNGEGFDKAYYASADDVVGITAGWKLVSTANEDQKTYPVPFTAGLIIQRRDAAELKLTFTGHVKLTPTQVPVYAPYTYISRVYPIGVTVGNSGLGASLKAGDANTASIIWIPKGPSDFEKAYIAVGNEILGITAGWKFISHVDDKKDSPLPSGYIIQRNAAAFTATLTPPDSYSAL